MQQDLFDSTNLKNLNLNRRNSLMDLQSIRLNIRLDHAVAGIIGLLIFSVLIFSFGVEKGKKFAIGELQAEREKREQVMQEFRQKLIEVSMLQQEIRSAQSGEAGPNMISESSVEPGDVESAQEPSSESTTIRTAPEPLESQQNSENKYPAGKYTIQVVTYNSKPGIDGKLSKLRDRGYEAFIVPSGKFYLLCVNGFESRQDGVSMLKKLQSEKLVPKDAYVRPMPKAASA